MWYVETSYIKGETLKWVGLTKEQADEIYRQHSGWSSGSIYCRSGLMEYM